MKHLALFSTLAASGLLVFACSSSDGTGPTTTPGADGGDAADAGGDAAPTPAGTGTLKVLVLDYPASAPMRVETPLAGLTVSIDKPGGAHEEKTTDASGFVTFDAIDWSAGSASVVAYAADRTTHALTGVTPDTLGSFARGKHASETDVLLYPLSKSAALPVAVDVTLTNKAAASDVVLISGPDTSSYTQTSTTTVAMTVPANAPFSFLTYESSRTIKPNHRDQTFTTVRWASFDEAALAGPTGALTLDMAAGGTTLTPATKHLTYAIPGGDAGPLGGGIPTATVTTFESTFGLYAAQPTDSTFSTDGTTCAVTMEHLPLDGQTPIQQYYLVGGNDSTFLQSWVYKRGLPVEGDTVQGFITPIAVALGAKHSADDTFDLSGAEAGTYSRVVFGSDNVNLLVLDAPPGAKSTKLPTLPADARKDLKTADTGFIVSAADIDDDAFIFMRGAYSQTFHVTVK